MAENFGVVDFLGVERSWLSHPTFAVYLVKGLPGFPAALLIGTETAVQLARPWLLSVRRKLDDVVVFTQTYASEAAALTALKSELALRLGVSQAKLDRIDASILSGISGGDIAAQIRKRRKIDPDATDI